MKPRRSAGSSVELNGVKPRSREEMGREKRPDAPAWRDASGSLLLTTYPPHLFHLISLFAATTRDSRLRSCACFDRFDRGLVSSGEMVAATLGRGI